MVDIRRSATARALRPRAGSSGKAMLLTVLGELVLPHGSSVWTSTLVRSLGLLGVGERNARQAVGRLAEQGLLRAEKHGRKARWHLTERSEHLLTTGTERIYRFGADADGWDGRWLVVLCSVPEHQRAKRHQLRTRLGFAGFGFLNAGVAMTPHLEREEVAVSVLRELDLLPDAVILRAETGSDVEPTELLRGAWDLERLAAEYEEFIAAFQRRSPRTDESRFAAVVELVHAWRRFPFVDPEIPTRLLEPNWPGRPAKELFDARHAVWRPSADTWYERTEAAGE